MPIKLPTPPPMPKIEDIDSARKYAEKLNEYVQEVVRELEKKVTT